MAFDSQYDGEAAPPPPISLHPAFPAVVALWFAALLGIGSLVLPAVLIESAVVASGISAIVPAASPPLGFTARGIIAIVATVLGAGLGVAIARRIAKAHSPRPESRLSKLVGGPRAPLSVREEVVGEGVVNGQGLPITRRRALAISEDDRPSDFLYHVPLPGQDVDIPAPYAPLESAPADEPFELSDLADEAAAPVAQDEIEPDSDEEYAMTDRQEFQPISRFGQTGEHAREFEPLDELDERKNRAGPRGLEPLPFSPPSLARRAQLPAEPEIDEIDEAPVFEAPVFDAPVEPVAMAVAPAADDEVHTRADWQSAPLDGLGLVQLVQRLGSTIERRRELRAQTAAAPVTVAAPFAAVPADIDPAPAEEAALAMAAFFAPELPAVPEGEELEAEFVAEPADEAPDAELPRPRFLVPFADDEDDEDAIPDFSLPLGGRPAAALSSLSPDDFEDEDEAEEPGTDEDSTQGYSSLLGLSNPFAAPKAEFVRIEEPEPEADAFEPAVVFPGRDQPAAPAASPPAFASRMFDPPGKDAGPPAAAPAPADTDAALRAALATLQRMSGAA